jgi:hypothetical protein
MQYRKPETQSETAVDRPGKADTSASSGGFFNGQPLSHQRLVRTHWVIGRPRKGRFCCQRGRARIEVV